MAPLQMNGLTMPADFPITAFENIYTALQLHSAEPVHPQFIGAWMAISYRFKAMASYDESFTANLSKGPARTIEVRFEEERDLFGFAGNAYSVFDCFFYAMFAWGALMDSSTFVLSGPDDERKVSRP